MGGMAKGPVIGLTGPLGAGRSAAAEYLERQHGYQVVSLSQILRSEAKETGSALSLEKLQNLGDQMRAASGAHVLAEKALAMSLGEPAVLDGIKNPAEAEWLDRHCEQFYLVAVDAARPTRSRRKVADSGALSQIEFDNAEQRDHAETDAWGVLVETGQQVERCVRIADFVIWNDELLLRGTGSESSQDGHIESLHGKLDRMLDTISQPGRYRPSDGELLMAQAVVASRGSECMQRKVGAVIASTEGRIHAVGCNNTPVPLKSCRALYGKCYREMLRDRQMGLLAQRFCCAVCKGQLDDQLKCSNCGEDHAIAFAEFRNLDFCRALHAEEDALLQLAGATGARTGELHLYTTTFPCSLCAKKIVNARIGTVFFVDPYPGEQAYESLRGAATRVEHFEGFTLRGTGKVWAEV